MEKLQWYILLSSEQDPRFELRRTESWWIDRHFHIDTCIIILWNIWQDYLPWHVTWQTQKEVYLPFLVLNRIEKLLKAEHIFCGQKRMFVKGKNISFTCNCIHKKYYKSHISWNNVLCFFVQKPKQSFTMLRDSEKATDCPCLSTETYLN